MGVHIEVHRKRVEMGVNICLTLYIYGNIIKFRV